MITIQSHVLAERRATVFNIEVPYDYMLQKHIEARLENEIVDLIAKKFVEVHGDEILKRILEQTVNAKVIQKVVSNLRKELQNEKK